MSNFQTHPLTHTCMQRICTKSYWNTSQVNIFFFFCAHICSSLETLERPKPLPHPKPPTPTVLWFAYWILQIPFRNYIITLNSIHVSNTFCIIYSKDTFFISKHNFIVLVWSEAWEAWKFTYPGLSDDSWKPWEGAAWLHTWYCGIEQSAHAHVRSLARTHTCTHTCTQTSVVLCNYIAISCISGTYVCKFILLSFVWQQMCWL